MHEYACIYLLEKVNLCLSPYFHSLKSTSSLNAEKESKSKGVHNGNDHFTPLFIFVWTFFEQTQQGGIIWM